MSPSPTQAQWAVHLHGQLRTQPGRPGKCTLNLPAGFYRYPHRESRVTVQALLGVSHREIDQCFQIGAICCATSKWKHENEPDLFDKVSWRRSTINWPRTGYRSRLPRQARNFFWALQTALAESFVQYWKRCHSRMDMTTSRHAIESARNELPLVISRVFRIL